jgi:hypothetical protein
VKISFDLDGVLCNAETSLLGVLHDRYRQRDEGAFERLRNYYLGRDLRLDPRLLLADGDEFYVITGRIQMAWEWTEQWTTRMFGERYVKGDRLHFVANEELEELLKRSQLGPAGEVSGARKAELVRQLGVELHVDNNPVIVKRMRALGLTVVQYGGMVNYWEGD